MTWMLVIGLTWLAIALLLSLFLGRVIRDADCGDEQQEHHLDDAQHVLRFPRLGHGEHLPGTLVQPDLSDLARWYDWQLPELWPWSPPGDHEAGGRQPR